MTVGQSLLVALFCICVVFTVLACLWALLRLFSLGFGRLTARAERRSLSAEPPEPDEPAPATAGSEEAYAGQLKLVGVDEPTAAMIMAIVSDTSGIPLSELTFRSIRLLERSHDINELAVSPNEIHCENQRPRI